MNGENQNQENHQPIVVSTAFQMQPLEDAVPPEIPTPQNYFKKRLILASFLAISLFVFFGGWWWNETKQPSESTLQEMPSVENELRNSLDDNSIESEDDSLTASELLEPVQVLTVPTDSRWEDNRWQFAMTAAHVAPIIFDLENQRTALAGAINYLIFEIQVTDTRDVGEPRLVSAHSYANIRRESKNETPIGDNYLMLSPRESGVVYVLFEVPKEEFSFLGLTGILSNPYLVNIDLTGQDVEQRLGLMSAKNGFLESSTNLATPTAEPFVEPSVAPSIQPYDL
ncbi:MAG: hypothetical protein WAU07_03660 [Microgenomates group bacterium]